MAIEIALPTLTTILFTAAIDSINPCAIGVLILLISTFVVARRKNELLKIGLIYIAAVYVTYFLFGLGLIAFLSFIPIVIAEYISIAVGLIVVFMGLLEIKDYFWYGKVFLMEVPLSWRPKMKSFVRGITNPWGGFLIALLVSLFLLPCTAGPYFVILGMLAHKVAFFKALSFLILYNLIFILPMLAIVLLIYYGLSPEKAENWRKQKLRLLHLIAGVILITLGIAILSGWI